MRSVLQNGGVSMKLFNRRHLTSEQILPETKEHPEPEGHVHPNYRYLAWFRPSSSKDHA
ncbi:hypothetical protein OsccyDRAFT_0977 [Leptolyngbyaceae cyanobacterium JSC-12]|nr:hypothetical protein OsccyDRAFT_0977 [Leptolyngbyaceae cyanobacterium JSC-12]